MSQRLVANGVSLNVRSRSETEIEVRLDFDAPSQLAPILLVLTPGEFADLSCSLEQARDGLGIPMSPNARALAGPLRVVPETPDD